MNKRFNIVVCLSILGCLASGCKKKEETPTVVTNETSYDQVYNGKRTKKYQGLITATTFNRASYAYNYNNAQNYKGWKIVSIKNNVETELTATDNIWKDDDCSLSDGIINTSNDKSIGMIYKCSSNGTYCFNGTLKSVASNTTGGTLEIYKNDEKIYPKSGTFSVSGNDFSGLYFEDSVILNNNDLLKFIVKGNNVYCNPSLRQGSDMYDSLYTTHTDWGCYGDIHAYYYRNTLHMYHLWNHTGNDEGWRWYMQDTTDMFRYTDNGYDDSFITNHYMSYGKAKDVFADYYLSSRDCTYFFDKRSQRYGCIGLCYVEKGNNIHTVLAGRISDDPMGLEWTKEPFIIRDFPTTSDGEPECSQLYYWGDRWYVSTGISGQSVHGIGRYSYWIGDVGKNWYEIDWQSKLTNELDGEDLCVAQVESIGDRKYMFGWMPLYYNAYHWGGPKNLPREVYRLEDGKLASRIDERATTLMNKGKFYSVGEGFSSDINATVNGSDIIFNQAGTIMSNKRINSSFNMYNVTFGSATEVSFVVMNNSTNMNYVTLYKGLNNELRAKVTEYNGYVNSDIFITNEPLETVSCKVVAEQGTIEFDVNGLKVLSARTSKVSIDYTPGFKANGSARVSNISLNRLAQLYDVYD